MQVILIFNLSDFFILSDNILTIIDIRIFILFSGQCTMTALLTTLVFFGTDFCYRIYKAWFEYKNYKYHYSDIREIINLTFSYNVETIIFYLFNILLTFAVFPNFSFFHDFFEDHNHQNFISLLGIGLGIFLCLILKLQKCDLNNAHWIRWEHNLDYGSGSAIAYYHGYLRIIGPSSGTEIKGIVERIEIYESNQGVEIPIKKLFIFIPKDFYIPPQLSLVNSDKVGARRLEVANSLESLYIDRAGVRNREYGNTVYRLKTKYNKNWYVCIEGATPIYTMNETIKQNPQINKMKRELLFRFHDTLKELIADAETKHLFELILFDNKDNLADLIENRINELLGKGNK